MAVPAAVLSGQTVRVGLGVLPKFRAVDSDGSVPAAAVAAFKMISACNAATGIPSLRAATVLTRPDRLARRLLRGSVRGPPLSPQPARLGLAESESLALAAGLPAGPAAAGANRAKSDNPGDDDP